MRQHKAADARNNLKDYLKKYVASKNSDCHEAEDVDVFAAMGFVGETSRSDPAPPPSAAAAATSPPRRGGGGTRSTPSTPPSVRREGGHGEGGHGTPRRRVTPPFPSPSRTTTAVSSFRIAVSFKC